MKLLIILFITMLNISSPTASPTGQCNKQELIDDLLRYALDPDINNNGSLLDAVELTYGKPTREYLTLMHPHLESSPASNIDLATLGWLKETIWDIDTPKNRYFIVLPLNGNVTSMDEYAFALIDTSIASQTKLTLVFMDPSEANDFISYVKSNLKQIIKKYDKNLSEHEVNKIESAIALHHFDNKNYKLGLGNLSFKEPIVVIHGHGTPKDASIKVGNQSFSSKDISQHLKKINLPVDSSIILNVCFSGCSKYKLNYTTSQLKKLFLNGNLFDIVANKSDNFLNVFSKDLTDLIPLFRGEIKGYLGSVEMPISEDVLRRNGTVMLEGFAVSITGLDGVMLVKKEDAEIKRSFDVN